MTLDVIRPGKFKLNPDKQHRYITARVLLYLKNTVNMHEERVEKYQRITLAILIGDLRIIEITSSTVVQCQ